MIISDGWDYEGFPLSIFAIYNLLKFSYKTFFYNQEKDIFNPLQFINRWYPTALVFTFALCMF